MIGRHPVVITSLEEDFRKLGLYEGRDEPSHAAPANATNMSPEEELEDEEKQSRRSALAEAVEFHERFKEAWAELGEQGVETVYLSDEDMISLEGMSCETVELPAGVIDDPIEEDDDLDEGDDEGDDEEDDDEEDDDEEDDDEEMEDRTSFESVTRSLRSIESLLAEGDLGPARSSEDAIPAFANLALVAERLHDFFSEAGKIQEDKDCIKLASDFALVAKYAAGIVDVLKEEDEDSIDFRALRETFSDYLDITLKGLETYAVLRESDNAELDEDEDDDAVEETEEGNA